MISIQKRWTTCIHSLAEIVDQDVCYEVFSKKNTQPRGDGNNQQEAFLLFSVNLYLRYLEIGKELDSIYNEFVEPQKRDHIQETIECVLLRIIQFRQYFYSNRLTNEVKVGDAKMYFEEGINLSRDLVSREVRFRFCSSNCFIPSFVKEQQQEEEMKEQQHINFLLSKRNALKKEQNNVGEIGELGEINKDGRQMMNTAMYYDLSESEFRALQDEKSIDIQRLARGFLVRNRQERGKEMRRSIVGMTWNSENEAKKLQQSNLLNCKRSKTRYEQIRNRLDFEHELNLLRENVVKEESFQMKEELQKDRIRWITSQIAEKNEIPCSFEDFYKEERKLQETTSTTDVTTHEQVVSGLLQTIDSFEKYWKSVELDRNIPFCKELAKDLKVRNEVEKNLRAIVDDQLVTKLIRMKESGGKENNKKKGENKTKKGGKSGSSKLKKGKPLPGEKLLKGMSKDSMLKKLVAYDLISISSSQKGLDDIISSVFPTNDKSGYPNLSMTEVKRLLSEYVIYPNCNTNMREKSTIHDTVRSILLYGHDGVGKESLVRALAVELKAVIIDLSPSKIPEEVLREKSGPTKLIHMIFEVCNSLESPVILLIKDCEKYFEPTKKKKGNALAKFQKDLLLYKNRCLDGKKRTVVVGTSTNPELTDTKALLWKGDSGKPEKQGFFERKILVPVEGDRGKLFESVLSKYYNEHKVKCPKSSQHLDFHFLSTKSKDYSLGAISTCLEKVLSSSPITLGVQELENVIIEQLSSLEMQTDDVYFNFSKKFCQCSQG